MRKISNAASRYQRIRAPATALLMTCLLSACDLPGTTQQSGESESSAVGIADLKSQPVSTANMPRKELGLAAIEKAPEPDAVDGNAADENTPVPSEIELTPMENAGNPGGNAQLAIRYQNAEALGDAVAFNVDKREYLLKRDDKDPKRFAGMVDFDFDVFKEEQETRKRDIAEAKVSTFPVFDGRELIGEERFESISPEELKIAREKSTPIRIRPSLIAVPPPPGLGLDPSKALMITDLSVVQDPTRTFDVCGNAGDPDGAWTFKTLMTEMANPNATGVHPADFVEDWLQSWNVNHTINTFPVPARSNINARVLNAWPRDADGRLDLNQSPMRLLAIVNRIDLRRSSVQSTQYGGGGGIPLDAGEGRFVFGVVDRNNNGGCSKMEFTVILEYGVPIAQCTSIRSYAQQWQGLNGLTLGSAAFNPALQAITDQFTVAGAGGNKPNGSAINQVRTNEIALSRGYRGDLAIDASPAELGRAAAIPVGQPWELREFHLRADNMLHIVSTKDTPHHTWNNTPLLASFINSGITSVPTTYLGQPFLTGSTLNFSVADSAVWNAPGVATADRHRMSLNTCNACHGGETRDNTGSPDTRFVHITTRNAGAVSGLSKFLVGNGTLSAPSSFSKADPILQPQTLFRPFGDLERRQTLLPQLAFGSCRATGLLQEASFRRLQMVH